MYDKISFLILNLSQNFARVVRPSLLRAGVHQYCRREWSGSHWYKGLFNDSEMACISMVIMLLDLLEVASMLGMRFCLVLCLIMISSAVIKITKMMILMAPPTAPPTMEINSSLLLPESILSESLISTLISEIKAVTVNINISSFDLDPHVR